MSREPQHTPGPWRAEEEDALDSVPFIPIEAGEAGAWRKVCEVNGEPEGLHIDGVALANARLIAAAPDHALICWAMCVQDARWDEGSNGEGEFCFAGLRHWTRLDEFGCPVLTENLRAVLTRAKAATP
jgi:hypothetical protein